MAPVAVPAPPRVRTYKYRLYPTQSQEEALESWLGFAASLYNAALQTVKDPFARNRRHRYRFWDGEEWVWRDAKPPVTGTEPSVWGSELTQFRQEHPDLLPAGMPALVQHEVLTRVKRTISAMFSRAAAGKKAGNPRYRSAGHYDSLTFGLTAPSRPPAERDEEWLAEHADELTACIEHIASQVAAGREASAVKAKELREVVAGRAPDAKRVTTDVARSLRVLALRQLGYEPPPGVTVGAGILRDEALHLTGLGELALRKGPGSGLRLHRPLPKDCIPRSVVVRRSCDCWYASISVELPAVQPSAEEKPPVGLDMGVYQWCTAFTPDALAAERLAADLRRMATDPLDHRRLWAAERHLRRLSVALARCAALGVRPPHGFGARAARLARMARRRHARVLFRLRQVEAQATRVRQRLAAGAAIAVVVPDEAGAAVLIEGSHAGPRHAQRVARTQRRVARRTLRGHKHSHRRKKAVSGPGGYARAKERERNLRGDHRHKASRALVEQFGLICVEKLDIKKLTAAPGSEHAPATELPADIKRRLDNKILDQAWDAFFTVTGYKAEDAGSRLEEKSAVGTTIDCARCGNPVPKPMTLRVHSCPACGYVVARQVNSARNVLQRPLEQPGRAGPSGANGRGSPHAVA